MRRAVWLFTSILLRHPAINFTQGGLSPYLCDQVVNAHMGFNKMANKKRGFGFVKFSSADGVDAAMSARPHEVNGSITETKRVINTGSPEDTYTVTNLFVGGLKNCHNEDNLREYFNDFGKVVEVKIPKTFNEPRQHKGYGFVEFDDYDAVDKVIRAVLHRTAIMSGLGCLAVAAVAPARSELVYSPLGVLGLTAFSLYGLSWQRDPCCRYQVLRDPKRLAELANGNGGTNNSSGPGGGVATSCNTGSAMGAGGSAMGISGNAANGCGRNNNSHRTPQKPVVIYFSNDRCRSLVRRTISVSVLCLFVYKVIQRVLDE